MPSRVTALGCTSTLHDRRDCDRAYSNDEIGPDDWCPACLHRMDSRIRAAKRIAALGEDRDFM